MSVIETIRQKRKKLVEALDLNEIKDHVFENFADMYPDKAHFIYELLQNAEDANATEVRFHLHQDRLLFEHNGRSFDDDDIDAITLIGKSPKQSDKIGRFGIGFKAVYLYTETPHIWSPAYSFKITDYCVPDELEQDSQLGVDTRFEFPFDKTDSSQLDICQVIKKGLEDISLNSLLFLANIKSLKWSYNNTKEILISRIEHPHHHVEIMQTEDEREVRSSDFLLFKKPVMELKAHNLALAYELEESSESPNGELKDRFKIRKASPGSVAIYFTAAKETSNLNFHLHAPFIPTRDRSSVKDIEENISLINQLASLATESLEKVRDIGLLDSNFLNVMPNSEDNLPDSYECIKVAIAKAMYNRPLIPTVSGEHQPAKQLLQGAQIRTTQSIVRLFSKQDLKYLFDNGKGKTDWAIGVGGRASRLLKDLKIEQIDFENIIKVFHNNLCSDIDTREIMFNWMNSKSDQWFQYYYAFMYSQISRLKISGHRQILQGLEIVRLADGKYKKGDDCFFQPEEGQGDSSYPLVAHSTYSSGSDSDEEKKERENARDFLKYLNVRELGKAERIEMLLKNRYQGGNPQKIDWKTYVKDLKNFVKFGLEDSEMINLFRKYEIFASTNETLCVSEGIYLDQPYAKTGLKEYYDQLNKIVEEAVCLPLSERYKTLSKKELAEFIDFAKRCGIRSYLKPTKTTCKNNPYRNELTNTRGQWNYNTGINEDFMVEKLDEMLNNPAIELSHLIWNNIQHWHNKFFVAKYMPNSRYGGKKAPSQLLHHLINCKWIPQESGNSKRFVRPALAERELMPASFTFDQHASWLNDIQFGHKLPDKVEGEKIAEQCGFENFETMKQMAEFGIEMKNKLPERWNAFSNKPSLKLPDQQPEDYERLQTEVRKEAEVAPRQEFTRKLSRVSNVDVIKRDKTDDFLREMYTNEEKVMFCQICENELPFKLSGGKYFFEKVKFIKGLKGIHYQNYLALCPNHAAMYMHANDSIDEMLVRFRNLKPNTQRVELILAGNPFHIYFTKKHIAHLKAVLEVTDSNPDMSDDTESPIEDMLLAALREIPELPEPERHYEIRHNGHLVTVPDFAYPDFRIAIYCDGYAYHGNRKKLEQDAKKRNWLQVQGWSVLTYWGGTIYESPQDCAVEIKKVYLEKSNGNG